MKITQLNDPSIEKTHGYLERFHYQAVKDNPMYALEGNMDIIREEISRGVYGHLIPPEPQPPEPKVITHLHMDTKSLELNRRLNDIDTTLQEHLKLHWDKKKGQPYQFNSVEKGGGLNG